MELLYMHQHRLKEEHGYRQRTQQVSAANASSAFPARRSTLLFSRNCCRTLPSRTTLRCCPPVSIAPLRAPFRSCGATSGMSIPFPPFLFLSPLPRGHRTSPLPMHS
jgi:hypothetical protein